VLLSTIAIAIITIALPYSPLATLLGLTTVPARILAALVGLTALYVAANELANTDSHPPIEGEPPAMLQRTGAW
jgi:hypothetical protein